jgi:hypothetical protein
MHPWVAFRGIVCRRTANRFGLLRRGYFIYYLLCSVGGRKVVCGAIAFPCMRVETLRGCARTMA